MNEVRQYRRRPLEVVHPQTLPITEDPEVLHVLNRFAGMDKENAQLRAYTDRQAADISARDQRIIYLENELRRVTHLKETFERGYFSIYEQMQIFGRGAISCLEVSNKAMIREGAAITEAQPDALDDGAEHIGQKFGAGT